MSVKNSIHLVNKIVVENADCAAAIRDRLHYLLSCLQNSKPKSLNTEESLIETPRSQNELERKRVDERLRGFSLNTSNAWKSICERYGPNLNQVELLSIAEVVCNELNLKVDREAKRRKEVLIKWFDENFSIIQPLMDNIVLEDESGLRIDQSRFEKAPH